jgi:hypothetical protein
MITADDFKRSTGYEPEQDDLERANCPLAGQPGHVWCGICRHGEVLFTCIRCVQERTGHAIVTPGMRRHETERRLPLEPSTEGDTGPSE